MAKFKVGDRVSWSGKKGKIVEVELFEEYPLVVKFDDRQIKRFTEEGKSNVLYKEASLVNLTQANKPKKWWRTW